MRPETFPGQDILAKPADDHLFCRCHSFYDFGATKFANIFSIFHKELQNIFHFCF
jgi:hypothetical protein